MRRLAVILSLSLSAVAISTDALAQRSPDGLCYIIDAQGNVYDLSLLCSRPAAGGAPTQPVSIINLIPTIPAAPAAPAAPTTVIVVENRSAPIQRSTNDSIKSSRNSWVSLRDLRRDGDYIRGTAFNQGQKAAESISIRLRMFDRSGLVWSGRTSLDTLILGSQQGAEFEVYLPSPFNLSEAYLVRGSATWLEYE